MRIRAYLRTKLAKPYHGKHYHAAGTEVVFNSRVQTKSLGDFLITPPDPVSFSLNNAENLINSAILIKEELSKSEDKIVYPKKYSLEQLHKIHITTPEQILSIDPSSDVVRNFDSGKIYQFMQNGADSTTALVASVEAFVNIVLPFDYTETIFNKKTGRSEVLTKDQIVRKFSIEQKLESLANASNLKDFKKENFWATFKEIKRIRNLFIHFKKLDTKIDSLWGPIIIGLIDADLQKFFEDIVSLIKYFRPNHFD